ncbi:MAG: gluconate 2-dehydrogenase subunit 3 family protein [Vicinamibacterales bacterium]|nr:gluconate 2-dehydrogenase subunit 3 family protein [Vicinamibacterales bacterium]MDP7470755.1 gluconate 2-dehydrogenase subunit 3 family protein [Vicinamibacterales bacterium]MDP7673106.1 gluconate 2-dehydrogenase subunit 3 family protein [Vicinamibacterales bacterium]HJO37635.1 gluconate 2-dehydrogenase subunit 3 family protein [Vicinamibacterales bacterium]
MKRRDAIKRLTAPVAAGLVWTAVEARSARERSDRARREALATQTPYTPQFFTAVEYASLSALVEIILPADDRSGGAADAGVPEFIDFMMIDQPVRQGALRGGLAWLDIECQRRFERQFTACDAAQRGAVLDDIAWPDRAPDSLSQGVAFFSSVRDLTATGFWTSQIGIDDLQYLGNEYLVEWRGCAPEALDRLGVRYDD